MNDNTLDNQSKTEREKLLPQEKVVSLLYSFDPALDKYGIGLNEVISPQHPSFKRILHDNPHMRQIEITGESIRIFPLEKLSRVLAPNAPREKYQRRSGDLKTVNHWGQRKLLMSEIEFLTMFHTQADVVVYAGAAPGTHIGYLSGLFPRLKFVLVDPADFTVKSTNKIDVRQEFFTDDIAKEFSSQRSLFICDIRTADWKVQSSEEVEDSVEADQKAQLNWVQIMNPVASILKFRLPWGAGATHYLEGDIYLPVWGPVTTIETRLITRKNAGMIYYNHKRYEERLFYFNTVTRVQYYSHGIVAEGLCHCFDCASEIIVLFEYLRAHDLLKQDMGKQGANENDYNLENSAVKTKIVEMINRISRECSPHGRRTLATNVSEGKKGAWFGGRKFDVEKKIIVDVDSKVVKNNLMKRVKDKSTFEYKPRDVLNIDDENNDH